MYGSVNVHCCVGYGRRPIGSRFYWYRALAESASGGRALVVTLTLGGDLEQVRRHGPWREVELSADLFVPDPRVGRVAILALLRGE